MWEQFASTRYEYDRNGNIIRIQLPAGGEILREYDAANRLIAETHREERSGIDNRTQFGYDAAGNLTEITDNQGRKTRIAYDLLNREIGASSGMAACSARFMTATARWCG